MHKATYTKVCKWILNFWNKILKHMIEKTFLKARISDFLQKSANGVPTISSVFFNDNDSSDIDKLLPFEHVEIFHIDYSGQEL